MWLTLLSLALVMWLISTAYGLLPMLKPPSWENPFAKPPYYDYENTVADVLSKLTPATRQAAESLLSIPEEIRGYGHVKEAAIEKARALQAERLGVFRAAVAGDDVKRAA